ncbi:hypothetical protein Tco_1384582 [Tanacetum coccineum]
MTVKGYDSGGKQSRADVGQGWSVHLVLPNDRIGLGGGAVNTGGGGDSGTGICGGDEDHGDSGDAGGEDIARVRCGKEQYGRQELGAPSLVISQQLHLVILISPLASISHYRHSHPTPMLHLHVSSLLPIKLGIVDTDHPSGVLIAITSSGSALGSTLECYEVAGIGEASSALRWSSANDLSSSCSGP